MKRPRVAAVPPVPIQIMSESVSEREFGVGGGQMSLPAPMSIQEGIGCASSAIC